MFHGLKQGHAANLIGPAQMRHATYASTAPAPLSHAAPTQRNWRATLDEKVISLTGNLSRNASRLIAPLVRAAGGDAGHAGTERFPAVAQMNRKESESKSAEGKSAGMKAVPAEASKDSYRELAARASGFSKLDPGKAPRAAALYLGNSCTAASDVCKQFTAEVAKDKLAAVTAEANGMRLAAGMKVKLRYKF